MWWTCRAFNYNEPRIDQFHKDYPALPIVGSETASTVATRGIYENDKDKGYVRAYDTEKPPWAATAEVWWKFYAARPYLAGGFAWTGFDYRGEPTHLQLAVHQLPLRHHGHVRLPQRQLLLLPGLVGLQTRPCTSSPIGTGPAKRARKSKSGCTATWTACGTIPERAEPGRTGRAAQHARRLEGEIRPVAPLKPAASREASRSW